MNKLKWSSGNKYYFENFSGCNNSAEISKHSDGSSYEIYECIRGYITKYTPMGTETCFMSGNGPKYEKDLVTGKVGYSWNTTKCKER